MEKEDPKVSMYFNGETPKKPVEIILRSGVAAKAVEELPTKEPVKIDLTGVVTMPLEWLQKRVDLINHDKANIQVDREKMSITLVINEDDHYLRSELEGVIQLSEVYERFGINDEKKAWNPNKLGQFLRLNRAVFEDKEACMVMVSQLKNFTAKAKTEIQKQRDPSGSTADVYRSQVESNLPKSFVVNVPIFKGTEKQLIEVEFDHYVMDSEVYLQLVSPGANEITSEYRDRCIDDVLGQMRAIAPKIPVLEV